MDAGGGHGRAERHGYASPAVEYTWEEHTLLADADDMLPEAVLTCFAIEYGWSPCNGACTSCPPATVACVVGRRSMGEQDEKHGSMLTVMYRVRPV